MHVPDLVNGSFEALGGFLLWVNCWRLYRDKEVKGVYWPVMVFFWVWGCWNCWYYPHLNQWLSLVGGLVTCTANLVWVLMALYYRKRRR